MTWPEAAVNITIAVGMFSVAIAFLLTTSRNR
jgi:hypothetical protein